MERPPPGLYRLDHSATLLRIFTFKAPSLAAVVAHDLEFHCRDVTGELRLDTDGGDFEARAQLWAMCTRDGLLNRIEWAECQRLMRKKVLKTEARAVATLRGSLTWPQAEAPPLLQATLQIFGGPSREILLPCQEAQVHGSTLQVSASFEFLQSDYGIKPFEHMFGMFKLKDEMRFIVESRWHRV